jgi:hypothetical protein
MGEGEANRQICLLQNVDQEYILSQECTFCSAKWVRGR